MDARSTDIKEMSQNEKCVKQVEISLNGKGKNQTLNVVDKGPPKWRSQRYILAYIMFAGMMNMFFQRVNIGIAIICMVNHTALSHDRSLLGNNQSSPHDLFLSSMSPKYHDFQLNTSTSVSDFFLNGRSSDYNNTSIVAETQNSTLKSKNTARGCDVDSVSSETKTEDGPFLWDKETQGLLLGAMYWTYMVVQVPGNHLVRRFQKRTMIIVSMSLLSILTLLTHVVALWSPWALFALRLVQGGCVAICFISMYAIWMKWAPPHERATLLTFSMSGQMLGNVLVFPLSALLCKYGFLGGWPSVFYVFGISGILWVIIFFVLSAESPSNHRFITDGEKDYIVSSLAQTTAAHVPKVPWMAILTAPQVWAIACAHVSYTWGLLLNLATLPQYMNEVLKVDIKSNGVYNMMPYIALLFIIPGAGKISDVLVRRKILTVIWTRRICLVISNITPAVSLSAMSFLDCTQPGLAVALLVIGVGATGFGLTVILVNPYDIAPRYASVIITLTNTLACLPGVITPYIVAAVTKDQTREQWQIVFFLTAGIYVAGILGFWLLGKGEVQHWALEDTKNVEEEFNVEATEKVEEEEMVSMLEK